MINQLLFIICFLGFSLSVQAKTLLVLGDSLSSAHGIPIEQGWVSLLEQRIIRQGLGYQVVNASISGETTLGAKVRLDKLIEDKQPELVIVELGGNDGLRGFPLFEIEQNLMDIVTVIKQSGSRIVLVPMQLPVNYGIPYNQHFMAIYNKVANELQVSLSQFILDDIAQYPELMQADGIHPTQAAQAMMLDNIWPSLYPLISP